MKLRGIDYTLPSADGSSGYVLTTDGAGVLSWEASAGGSAFTITDQTMYAGTSSGSSLSPGVNNNLFIGYSAGRSVTSGFQNTLLGAFAGDSVNTGTSNTFIGNAAGLYVTSGDENVFIGNAAGINQLAVNGQIAIGSEALRGSTTTSDNTGTGNIAIGYQAGYANTTGSNNYSIGWTAGNQTTTGGDNLFIGYGAGTTNTTGGYNVFLGHYNDGAASAQHNIAVGYNNDLGSALGSIALGSDVSITGSSQFVAGSQAYPITDVYFGEGPLSTAFGDATAFTIHGTSANSGSTNGGNLILAAGEAYAGGTSLGGSIVFKTSKDFSDAPLATRLVIDRDGEITAGGGSCGGDVRFCLIENRVSPSGNIGLQIANSATNTTSDGSQKMGLYIGTAGDYSGSGGADTTAYGIFISTTSGADVNYDVYASSGAYLSTSGTWTNASSRTLKENFVEVSGGSVLDKLQTLSIYEWNYLTDSPSVVHIGPVAEDFKQVFGYGQDNKSISTIDPAGIALAAIKELDLRVRNLANLSSAPVSIADQLISMAVRVKDLVVGSSEYRTGITMYDEVTGDPYCLSIANGSPKTVFGECAGIVPQQPQTTSSQDLGDSTGEVLTENPDQGSGGDESVTTEEDPPETQTDTPPDTSPGDTGNVQ
jgi:hypothetical protein